MAGARDVTSGSTDGGTPPGTLSRTRVTPVSNDVMRATLAARVRRNGGHGGGVLRVESPTQGVLFEATSGELAHGERAMRAADAFEIASITKTFTAALVLLLVEDGKLGLETAIGELLPREITERLLVLDGVDYGPRLTIRQLLSHRSGLPDYWTDPPKVARTSDNAFMTEFLRDADRMWEPDAIVPFIKKLRPIGPPGSQYHYCDSGYLLLGSIVERLARASLHTVLRARVLGPLALRETYFSYREEAPPGLSVSHRYEAKLDLHGQRRQSADWASGGLVSTSADLGRFILSLAGGKLFRQPTTFEVMKTWQPTGKRDVDYGLGLFRVRLAGDLGELWGHDGHGNAFAYYWPSEQISWVGTLNQTKNDWWELVEVGAKALVTE